MRPDTVSLLERRSKVKWYEVARLGRPQERAIPPYLHCPVATSKSLYREAITFSSFTVSLDRLVYFNDGIHYPSGDLSPRFSRPQYSCISVNY